MGSKWIYEPIIRQLAKDRFDLKIGSVKLRWFSSLEFDEISIREAGASEPTGNVPPLVSIRSIKTNRGLLGYLLNGRNIGRVEINDPVLDIALLEDGTSLDRLIKSLESSRDSSTVKTKEKPKLDLDIAIRRLVVQVEPPDGDKPIQVIPPVNADVSYRALAEEPMVTVQPMQVLREAELTPELVRLGLGLAIPLLAKSAWFDGKISLATQEIQIPLNSPLKSRGEATLILHHVRSGPSEPLVVGALDALANLRGKEPNHELVFVDGAQVVVKVADERVYHSGLEAGLPKLDPRLQIATEGYVGLSDRSLDLKLEIPIPIEQLARREKIQQLGVPKVKLPIGGTLDHPEIQWDTMRGESAALLSVIASRLQSDAPITSTVVEAISGVTDGQADQAISAAVDFVKAIKEKRAQAKEAESEKQEDAPKQDRRRPFRDALKKVLGND
jgi:hypothetical protein